MKLSSYHIDIGNATDVGKVREHNEDYMAHFDTPAGYCVVICDGMGGNVAGEEASQNAVAAIKFFLQDEANIEPSIPATLRNAIEFANYQIRNIVQKRPELRGMGTTCVLVLIAKNNYFIAHAGDSRLYMVRDGQIQQITKDHSVVQLMVDTGVLTEEEAERSEKKNQITKAIGPFEKVEPAVSDLVSPLLKEDILLLCSDGLTAHVSNQNILEVVSTIDDVQAAAIELIRLANQDGGTDNITIQVIRYSGEPAETAKKARKRSFLGFSLVLLVVLAIGTFAYMGTFGNSKTKKIPLPVKDTLTLK